LFNANEEVTKLPHDEEKLFHHIVAQLMYLCRQTHQDIQTAAVFLCTSVKCLDEDNYKKLTRIIQYLRDMQDFTLTIEADDNPQWWVNSSYAVHPDMKSHKGVLMSIGKGCTYMASSKQKLLRGIAYNSSTEDIDDVSKENTDDVSKENNKKVSFNNVTEEK